MSAGREIVPAGCGTVAGMADGTTTGPADRPERDSGWQRPKLRSAPAPWEGPLVSDTTDMTTGSSGLPEEPPAASPWPGDAGGGPGRGFPRAGRRGTLLAGCGLQRWGSAECLVRRGRPRRAAAAARACPRCSCPTCSGSRSRWASRAPAGCARARSSPRSRSARAAGAAPGRRERPAAHDGAAGGRGPRERPGRAGRWQPAARRTTTQSSGGRLREPALPAPLSRTPWNLRHRRRPAWAAVPARAGSATVRIRAAWGPRASRAARRPGRDHGRSRSAGQRERCRRPRGRRAMRQPGRRAAGRCPAAGRWPAGQPPPSRKQRPA